MLIYTHFIQLCGGEACINSEGVLAQRAIQLRQIRISCLKASYLHHLAMKYQSGILSDAAIVNMDDKSFTMLTMVSGIGSWYVHIFMIFSLHRPDVLLVNDLGIRKGVQLLRWSTHVVADEKDDWVPRPFLWVPKSISIFHLFVF
ncbi:putative DNA-3-methyladenine glycosylase II [Rosa chinensis]|uniref:Putative DNA-3-methyladenine glycosylase II n=1 Tax=Rosa chinensis TaxID=74649 RepID=A0A2P6SHB6_ROSCH|nr:putative DNA-3-methyladenine glycosylase II [Rosa chinensis]